MKKIVMTLMTIVLSVFVISCNSENSNDEGKMNIVTSTYSIYDLTTKIAGDKANVYNLAKSGDLHGFSPSQEDMKKMVDSDLIIINGANLESYIYKFREVNPEKEILDLSKKIDIIQIEEIDHLFISNGEDEHHHHHDHDHDHEHEHSHEKGPDPHYWTNPANVIIMMQQIRDELVKKDPANEGMYNKNFEKYSKELEEVKREYDEVLSKYKGRNIVVPHLAFNYVFTPYEITQVAVTGVHNDGDVSPAKIAEMIEILRENNIKNILYQYGKSSKIEEAIAAETNSNMLPISTITYLTQEDKAKGVEYIGFLKMNLETIKKNFESE